MLNPVVAVVLNGHTYVCNVFETQSFNLQASNTALNEKLKELQQTSESLEVSLSNKTSCSVYL